MTTEQIETVIRLLEQFGDDVPIKIIAQYAEDEFMIPFETAVRIIYEST